MKTLINLFSVSIYAIATLVIFSGCSSEESGTSPTKESEQDIGVLVLFQNGKPIAAVDNDRVSGTVTVQMDQNPVVYEVEFYDKNGELINNDPPKYELAWNYEDPELATFEQHEALKEWEFHIHGKKPGDTTFQLFLENRNSVYYSSPSIPLNVRQ